MKKQFLNIAAFALVAGALTLTGCKKDDTTAPIITLLGAESVTISLNSTYTDAGATAEDDRDGDISSKITSDVETVLNEDKTGTYTITYTVSDETGNYSTATRTVIVKNDAADLAGTYSVTESYPGTTLADYTYSQVVTASETINKRITFNKFGDYSGNASIYANITGTSLDLPSQSAVGIGGASENHTFNGTGTVNATSVLTINFTDVNTSNSSSAAVNSTWTKQ